MYANKTKTVDRNLGLPPELRDPMTHLDAGLPFETENAEHFFLVDLTSCTARRKQVCFFFFFFKNCFLIFFFFFF